MKKNYNFQLNFDGRGEYLIFSLPQTNNYQKIDKLKINSKYKLINEAENKIVVFTLNDVKNIKIEFALIPKINRVSLAKNITVEQLSNVTIPLNRFINGSDPKIKTFVKKIICREKNLAKIIRSLYDFTLNYLTYGKPIDGLYTYKQAMEKRITDCGGFSTFLASLLASVNIPSRLVVGFLIKENFQTKLLSIFNFSPLTFNFSLLTFNSLMMHAWLEIRLPNNSWFPADPSIEWRRNHGLTKRTGGFGFIPADRLVISKSCDFKLKIKSKIYQIDLLQKPDYL